MRNRSNAGLLTILYLSQFELAAVHSKMEKNSSIKLPNLLNLGAILPGHYGETTLPLLSSQVAFLSLSLSPRSVEAGFFLLKQGSNDCKSQTSLVLKPGKQSFIIIASYAIQVNKSTTYTGELTVSQQNIDHIIKLSFRVQIPRILCKKMLEDTRNRQKLIRIIINKAVTSEGRITLTNMEDYSLQLQPGLLAASSIADRDSPFLMKINSQAITAQGKSQFIVFVSLTTNIGFKKQFKGIKKAVLRNVLTLKTNSVLLWCLPLQVIVVFVKQPEMKE